MFSYVEKFGRITSLENKIFQLLQFTTIHFLRGAPTLFMLQANFAGWFLLKTFFQPYFSWE